MFIKGVIRISIHALNKEAGIGSRSHDLIGDDFTISNRSSSEIGEKDVKLQVILSGLATGVVGAESNFSLILTIF